MSERSETGQQPACKFGIVSAIALAGALAVDSGTSFADGHGMTLILNDMLNGGLVTEPSTARAIAEVIVADAYGSDELDRQRPLVVVDEDDRWHVAGSFNQDRQCDQSGPVSLWIRKSNAAVIDINLPFIMCVPPHVQGLIDKEMERRQRIDEEAQ